MPYIYYNPNPYHKNTGDRVVRAVSRLLGLTWEEAYVELSIQGYLDKALIVDDNVWGNYLARNGYAMHQFQQQFGLFQQQFQGPNGMNPQAIVQQKLNSGEMTQAQYEQLRQMANMIMGTNM